MKEKKLPYHVTKQTMDKGYNNVYKTNDIIVNDDFFVSFSQIIKYFGLHDTFDVESRISKANQTMEVVNFFGIQMQ